MDLVGPRYIKGDGKFYSVNLIDVTTHSCFVKAVRTKSSEGIVQAIASPFGKYMGCRMLYKWIMNWPLEAVTATRAALAVLSALCSARGGTGFYSGKRTLAKWDY